MAGPAGKGYNVKPPSVEFLQRTKYQKAYFYVDGKLYRTVRSDRPNDLLRAWSYSDKAVVDFVASSVKRSMQQAFDTAEVAKLLNRTKKNLYDHLKAGAIVPPQRVGEQAPDSKGNTFGSYKWSEDDVLAMHEHYLTVGSGRPRKDGMLSAAPRIPTRMELVAMMKQNRMMYVRDAKGNFVPIFEAPEWT